MFSFIKNYKLKMFLADALITAYPQTRMYFEKIHINFQRIFNLQSSQGVENFKKFIKRIYQQRDERIRLKMLMLLHFLIKKHQRYGEVFIENYKTDFGGRVQTYSNKSSSYIHPRQSSKSFRSVLTIKQADIATQPNINQHQQSYNSLHNYIYLHVIIPYHSYLIRFASSQQRYRKCSNNLQKQCQWYDSNQCWKLLNILKLVSNLKIPLNHIGRYYKDKIASITDFIQIISEDLMIYKIELQKQIQYAIKSYEKLTKIELEALVLQADQMFHENQNLFELFKNKYYTDVVHKISPKWFSIEQGSMQAISEYYKQISQFPQGKKQDDEIKESHLTSANSRGTNFTQE